MSTNRKTKSLILAAVLAAFAAAPLAAWADEPATATAAATPPPINGGDLSFAGSVNFTNAYYFRGYLNQNQGLIAQPAASMGAKVYEGTAGDPLTNFTLMGGIWTSWHGTTYSDPAPTANNPDSWYEADLSVGASVNIFDKTTFTFTFIDYTSPNGGFAETQELDQTIAFADAGMYGDDLNAKAFSINPHVTFAEEVAGTVKPTIATAPDLSHFHQQGVYGEIGIAPSLTILTISDEYPITLSFPVTVGLSISDYYVDANGTDKTFGYVSLGPTLSVPLAFISNKYGTWTASVGYQFMYLGDGVRDANVWNTGNTADYAHIVNGTIGFTY